VATAHLDADELQRYSRHLVLPEIGLDGQRKLKAASVLVVGAGGLGAPAAIYLAAAGVGRLGLVDFDAVESSNLQRQIAFSTADVGRPKLDAARDRLHAINPHVELQLHPVRLDASNALDLVGGYDIVVDGTDNFSTRYVVNDACVLANRPNVYGSIFRFEGQASLFAPGGPCYRCLYAEPPPPDLIPNCAEGGVLGVLPGIIGTIQAMETVKWIVGAGESLAGRLLLFDALAMSFRELRLQKDPQCALCGLHPTRTQVVETAFACSTSTAEVPVSKSRGEIAATELKQRLDRGDDVVVVDVREPHEWEICHIEGARLVPFGTLATHMDELPRDRDIVVHCRGGGRSARAQALLHARGFDRVLNLKGGIRAWIDDVDPTLTKY
jgi:adenylyltransferase/sulfurtransferase